jgi:hypothetical protein
MRKHVLDYVDVMRGGFDLAPSHLFVWLAPIEPPMGLAECVGFQDGKIGSKQVDQTHPEEALEFGRPLDQGSRIAKLEREWLLDQDMPTRGKTS